MKTAVIITPFDNYSYNVRIKYVDLYLRELGFENVTIISSDWNHRDKIPYTVKRNNLELLHVPPYKKNLSLKRLYSHFIFARRVYDRLKTIPADLIYVSVPPNYLIKYATKYKEFNPDVKVVCEVGDLWPETMPLNGWKKKVAFPILKMWSYIRDKYIHKLDGEIFECNLFKSIVGSSNKIQNLSKTIYLCKEDKMPSDKKKVHCVNMLEIAYLGSINHLIDTELIIKILSSINKKKRVLFHIIGNGESSSKLYKLCDKEGLKYVNHGSVYDDSLKYEILKRCAFGLNIMKDSVVVGATMKSLEYFHWGVAILNNIPADTEDIVNNYKCGYNISNDSIESVAQLISELSDYEINNLCSNSRKVYLELFDEKVISKQFKDFIINLYEE